MACNVFVFVEEPVMSPPMHSFIRRAAADVLVGVAAVAGFVFASRNGNAAGAILLATVCVGLLISAGIAGYWEPSPKWVWLHPLLIMSPELIALPVVLLTCKGFECGGLIGFLIMASLFTAVLIVFSVVGFLFRRRTGRVAHG
jgi:hypothetical protein